MDQERLNETLNELGKHLQEEGKLDPESQQLLQELSAKIDTIAAPTDGGENALAISLEEKDSLLDRMLRLTDDFEESHPQLAQALGNVADALSRIGI